MPVRINGSTSGYVELAAPAVAGSTSLTLPLTGFGKVLQVVNFPYNMQTLNETNVFASTGLVASITPASTSSKILVIVNQAGCFKETNNTYMELKLLRGASDLIMIEGYGGFTNTTAATSFGSCSATYLDSPATTSSTTYKTMFRSVNNNKGVYVQTNSSTSTMTLLEIGP